MASLQADGFSAHVDACAWASPPAGTSPSGEPGEHEQLWFVSMLGAQQALRALWARLVKGERVTLRLPAPGGLDTVRFAVLARMGAQGPIAWRLFSGGLPLAAGHHAVLVPSVGLYGDDRPEFLLLPRTPTEEASLHYRFLNRRLPLPLHPSWSEWLWRRARRTGEAAALDTFGITAYRCVPKVEALRDDLSAAVRDRQLQIPDE